MQGVPSTTQSVGSVIRSHWRTPPAEGLALDGTGKLLERTDDQIVAGIYRSPARRRTLFGERRHAFETDLRRLLQAANPTGIFGEQLREIAADIWRPRDD